MLGTREMILITRNTRNERKAANGPLTGMSAITITAKSKTLQGPRGKYPAMTNNPGSDLGGKDAEQRLVGQSQRLPPPGLD